MKYRLAFVLDGLPKTLNARMHWSVRSKEMRKWRTMVAQVVFGRAPKAPLLKAKITCTRVSSQPMDSDNLVSGFKPIIDGLVDAKVLVNDRFENIGMPDYRWEKGRKAKGCVKIEVEELE